MNIRLMEIADILLPHQNKFDYGINNLDDSIHFANIASEFNTAILPYVNEIAEITNNSVDTITSVFGPRGKYDVWFGYNCARYLADVAKYDSFNMDYITKQILYIETEEFGQ